MVTTIALAMILDWAFNRGAVRCRVRWSGRTYQRGFRARRVGCYACLWLRASLVLWGAVYHDEGIIGSRVEGIVEKGAVLWQCAGN